MLVLTKWMTDDDVRSVDEAVALQPNVMLKEKTYSVVQPAVDDVVANCVKRSKHLDVVLVSCCIKENIYTLQIYF